MGLNLDAIDLVLSMKARVVLELIILRCALLKLIRKDWRVKLILAPVKFNI